MKIKRIGWIATVCLACGALGPANPFSPTPALAQTGHDLFQQALVKEQAEGDLRAAIALYERIVEEFASDRPLAARALVQMGQCHERLGSQEAQKAQDAYRQVLDEYADQAESAEHARVRLAALERPEEEPANKTITTRKIWSGLDAGIHAPTPDGGHLVHSDARTGNLALREITSGETRILSHDTQDGDYRGRVSPNGRWIAYEHHVHGQWGSLRVVGRGGENLRELSREPGCWIQPYDWTSDGRQIAARRDCGENNPPTTHEIVLVSASDGTARAVHELPGYTECFLSPEDRYFVCGSPVEADDGNSDIWLLPIQGGNRLPLIQHPADDRILGWVPDSNFVVFLSNRDGMWDLWAVAVQDGTVEGSPRKIWRNMGEVDPAGFSEDGSFFYSSFTRWFSTGVAPFDPETGMADLEAVTPLLGSNRGPRWSPDGQRMAFVRESELTEGKYGRINIRDLSTGEQLELAVDLRARFMGNWSPDGHSLLVPGDDGRDEPHFWKVDVSSGETAPLVPVPDAYEWWGGWAYADWSPDGESLLYSVLNDGTGQSRLVRRDLSSGEEVELYRDSLLLRRPFELSPDGAEVAFVFMDSLDAEMPGGIAILDLETGEARRLVTFGDSLGEWEVCLEWTPDGESLLYSEILGGEDADQWHTRVSRIRVKGGEPERLWTFAEGKWGGWFELSPDGRQIALTVYTQAEEVWVMAELLEVLNGAG